MYFNITLTEPDYFQDNKLEWDWTGNLPKDWTFKQIQDGFQLMDNECVITVQVSYGYAAEINVVILVNLVGGSLDVAHQGWMMKDELAPFGAQIMEKINVYIDEHWDA